MRAVFAGMICLIAASGSSAQEVANSPGKLVTEVWQTASLDGQRSGYVHFSVFERTSSSGVKYLHASRKLSLTLLRFGQVARIEATTGTDELPDGKVLGVFMRQGLAEKVDLQLRGVVKDNVINVKAEGKMQFEKDYPWDPAVVGALGELNLVKQKKPQPGTAFDYMIFEPIICSLVKVKAKAEAIEQVNVLGQQARLLRVESTPTEVANITLPGSTFWFDAHYELVKAETIMPGMGKLVVERSTRELALQPCVGPDLGFRQSYKLTKILANPKDAAEVTYRIKLNDKDPIAIFAQDKRQSARMKDGALELIITPVRKPADGTATQDSPGAEFSQPNNFINSDDAQVKQHAAAAIGTETDPWKKAQLIEQWVYKNMKAMSFTEAMAPAAEVARTLRGDCTEYSMLTAAMARAVGIPSRTAIGLVYVEPQRNMAPMLAMHMWTEVWVRGSWVAIDSTTGRGSVGATHIKVTDASWHNVATMTPLMPLMRLMVSTPTIEIVDEKLSPTGQRTVEIIGEKKYPTH